jgi:ComEC/Rec2-related protein
MTLGIQEELPADVYQPFLIAGTMHVFAISGLHMALIGGVILGVLQLARMPRVVGASVMIAAIWAYTFATGWQPSAIRSTVMMTIVGVGWLLNRPGNLLNSLMAAGLVILLWDPQQFFGASFQLSFFVVWSYNSVGPSQKRTLSQLQFGE